MKIGLDGTTLKGRDGGVGAGIEHYTRSIVAALPSCHGSNQLLVARPIGGIPFVSRHVLLPVWLTASGCQVLLCPSGQTPLLWRGKSVIVIHDLAIYEHPEWFAGLPNQDFSVKFSVPRSIRVADRIIVPSHATKEQLLRLHPESEKKIVIVPHGVAVPKEFVSQPAARDVDIKDSIVSIGTIEPRKNLMNAVKAFDLFLKDHPERAASVQYIIAGREGWHHKEVLQEIKRVNDEWQNKSMAVIRYVGSVNEQEKWSLLQQSVGLLFPSWWEGFGLPVLEAMAVGTPVIASSRGALPEVGGDAAIYVEPDDTEQMALAIAQCVLMPDAMKELKESAKKRAAEFTWERTARETMKVIESV